VEEEKLYFYLKYITIILNRLNFGNDPLNIFISEFEMEDKEENTSGDEQYGSSMSFQERLESRIFGYFYPLYHKPIKPSVRAECLLEFIKLCQVYS
jgi:hypothetical protein